MHAYTHAHARPRPCPCPCPCACACPGTCTSHTQATCPHVHAHAHAHAHVTCHVLCNHNVRYGCVRVPGRARPPSRRRAPRGCRTRCTSGCDCRRQPPRAAGTRRRGGAAGAGSRPGRRVLGSRSCTTCAAGWRRERSGAARVPTPRRLAPACAVRGRPLSGRRGVSARRARTAGRVRRTGAARVGASLRCGHVQPRRPAGVWRRSRRGARR